MKKEFLEEAIRIGDEFLDTAKRDNSGIYWESLRYGAGDHSWSAGDSIYSGVGGITLFLMELYQETKEEKLFVAVKESLSWLWNYHIENPTTYHAFFTGRLGLAYVFMLASELTDKEDYLNKALEVALTSGNEDETSKIDDLINGAAGSIIGLLILHEKLQDKRLIEKIEYYTQKLLDRAVFCENGIYWDRSNNQSKGLCGFSHGTSGIGYAFLQLGKYFENKSFYFLSEMAFAYENQYFQEEFQNWPDFRKGFFDEKTLEEFKEKYSEGDEEYFKTPGSMRAWCHGSPGIGLSRVAAVEILGDEYLPDLKNAVESTIGSVQGEAVYHTYTLCHGAGGNSMLLMEAANLLPSELYQEEINKVGDNALAQKKQLGYYTTGFSTYSGGGETSLFMGDAGVGYFLLRAYRGDNKPTILKPEVTRTFNGVDSESILSSTLNDLKLILIKKVFPETIANLKQTLSFDKIGAKNAFQDTVSLISSSLTQENTHYFEFEKMKSNLDIHPIGTSYLHIKRLVETQKSIKFLEENDSKIDSVKLYLPPENKVFTDGEELFRLVVSTADGPIVYDELGFFAYLILSKYQEVNDIDSVVKGICDEYEVENPEEIRKTVSEQTLQAIQSGILYLKD